jgi:uncharacterized membrane protein YfcA
MPVDLAQFLPDGLPVATAVGLVVLSFFTSATTAALGLGGGAMLIAVMSLFMPAAIVVPVHGAVQLGSNGGRAILRRAHIQWQFAGWFVLGSVFGALVGGRVATVLPDGVFKILIAVFILYSAWAPQPELRGRTPAATTIAGFFTAIVGMITGISGPLVITFLRFLSDRREIVGTHAFLMTCQNGLKILSFILFGFAFGDYLLFILAMVASGFLGTNAGGMLLDRLPEKAFRIAFRVVLSLVALDLLRRAVFGA